MYPSRIPDYNSNTRAGMTAWFAEMANRNLLFHPEDRPAEIIDVETEKGMFTRQECTELDVIMAAMFSKFGDGVCDAAYPVFMATAGFQLGN
ncbi:MAG: hypothetical protein L0I62_02335 [Gammaproteobacteria bacterium]|nr:hypothetical protein [Gammaproteobacteria bacterium]